MAIPELLRELLTAPGPSGHEAAAAAVWREAAEALRRGDAATRSASSVARVARDE